MTTSTASEILSQTSTEIQAEKAIKRETQTTKWEEIETLLQNFPPEKDPIEYFKEIGLSPSSYYDAKRNGKARKVTKYALMGLLAEQRQEVPQSFTFDQLALFFTALLLYPEPSPLIAKQIHESQILLSKLISQGYKS